MSDVCEFGALLLAFGCVEVEELFQEVKVVFGFDFVAIVLDVGAIILSEESEFDDLLVDNVFDVVAELVSVLLFVLSDLFIKLFLVSFIKVLEDQMLQCSFDSVLFAVLWEQFLQLLILAESDILVQMVSAVLIIDKQVFAHSLKVLQLLTTAVENLPFREVVSNMQVCEIDVKRVTAYSINQFLSLFIVTVCDQCRALIIELKHMLNQVAYIVQLKVQFLVNLK